MNKEFEEKIKELTDSELQALKRVLLVIDQQGRKRIYDDEDLHDIVYAKNRKGKIWPVTRLHYETFRGRDGLEKVTQKEYEAEQKILIGGENRIVSKDIAPQKEEKAPESKPSK